MTRLSFTLISMLAVPLSFLGCGRSENSQRKADTQLNSYASSNDSLWNRLIRNSKQSFLFAHQFQDIHSGMLYQCWYQTQTTPEGAQKIKGLEDLLKHPHTQPLRTHYTSAYGIKHSLDDLEFWNTLGNSLNVGVRTSVAAATCNSLALSALGVAIGPFTGGTSIGVSVGLCGLAGMWGALDQRPLDGGTVDAKTLLVDQERLLNSAIDGIDWRSMNTLAKGIKRTPLHHSLDRMPCPIPTQLTTKEMTQIQTRNAF
jgi:hypothetical protein